MPGTVWCSPATGKAAPNNSAGAARARDPPDHRLPAVFAPAFSRRVNSPPSPCNGICRIAPHTGWCEGCRRTLAEIADWSMLDNAGKRAVLAQLPGRVPLP